MSAVYSLFLQHPIHFRQTCRCADVEPAASVVFAADLALCHGAAQQWCQWEHAGCAAGEQCGLIDADAAEGEAGAFRFVEDLAVFKYKITLRVMGGVSYQNQMRE